MANPALKCRMYEQKFPEVDDVVMVQVKSIEEMGAYVSLLEYNNIEGMILLSELSRRRIRSISKLIRVGRTECVLVLRVDKEKGYIDLSKRRVNPEDIIKCNDKYQKSKTVHSIMRHTADTHHLELEDFYNKVGWPLYKKYGHAHEAFKMAISKPEIFEGLEMTPEVRETLLENIQRRLKSNPFRIRADVELTCFTYHGVGGIKAALRAGEALSTEDNPVSIKLYAAPIYNFTTITTDEASGIEVVKKAIETVKAEIEKYNGSLTVKKEPVAIRNDDKSRLLSALEEDITAAESEEPVPKKKTSTKKKGGKKGKKKTTKGKKTTKKKKAT